jgi:YVTN family beta-propeller protein
MRNLSIVTLALASFSGFASANGCNEVIVSNEGSGDIAIVDPASSTVAARISVGKRPRGMALSPDRMQLYVALSGTPSGGPGVDELTLPPADKQADGIGVVDLTSRKLTRVIRGVSDPERVAVSRDGSKLFVASEDQGSLVMFDAASGKVLGSTSVGEEPEGVDLDKSGAQVFVAAEASAQVTVVDAKSAEPLARIEVGRRPRSTAFSPDGLHAYVANEASADISVIDTAAMRNVRTLKLPAGMLPMRVVVPPKGSPIYVSTGRGKEILAVDTTSGEVSARAESGARPWDMAISPDGTELYAANGPSNDLSLFELPALRLRGSVKTGEKPWGVVCRAPRATR